MSQRAALQAFDAIVFRSAHAAGVADKAVYQAPGGPSLPCLVMVDDGVEDVGDDRAPVSADRTLIAFQLSEVQPEVRAQVVITATGDVYKLARRVERDESSEQWEVQRA